MTNITDITGILEEQKWEVKPFHLKLPIHGYLCDINGKYSEYEGEYKAFHICQVFVHENPSWNLLIKIREKLDEVLPILMETNKND